MRPKPYLAPSSALRMIFCYVIDHFSLSVRFLDCVQRNEMLIKFDFYFNLGEAFDEHSQHVNGAVVSVRNKGDKIGMWMGDASQGDSIVKIGKKTKERLSIDQRVNQKNNLHNVFCLGDHLPWCNTRLKCMATVSPQYTLSLIWEAFQLPT